MKYAALALVVLAFMSDCREAPMISAAFRPGAPTRAERRLMAERADTMFHQLSSRRILVLPVAVIGREVRTDSGAARELAQRLRDDSLAVATAAPVAIDLPFAPSSNETAIFWNRFKALAAEVKGSPRSECDYVMLIDVFGTPERGMVDAVHFMVVTSSGDMVYGAGWNASHKLYKQVQPRSASDAARMVSMNLSERRRRVRRSTDSG